MLSSHKEFLGKFSADLRSSVIFAQKVSSEFPRRKSVGPCSDSIFPGNESIAVHSSSPSSELFSLPLPFGPSSFSSVLLLPALLFPFLPHPLVKHAKHSFPFYLPLVRAPFLDLLAP